MIRAVFFDIDGTLLDSSGQVPESALASIKKLHDQGVLIGICTGRNPSETRKFINDYSNLHTDIVIYANGALAEFKGELIVDKPISKNDVKRVVDELNLQHIPYWLSGKEQWYFSIQDLSDIKTILINEEWKRSDYFEPDYHLKNDVYMGEIFLGKSRKYKVLKSIENIDLVQGMLSGGGYGPIADFYSKSVNKATGVSDCLSELHMSPNEIMVFGDSFNDIPVIRLAGIGVAMGNSSDDVKSTASFVTKDINADGIEYALMHFGLI